MFQILSKHIKADGYQNCGLFTIPKSCVWFFYAKYITFMFDNILL